MLIISNNYSNAVAVFVIVVLGGGARVTPSSGGSGGSGGTRGLNKPADASAELLPAKLIRNNE